MQQPQPTAYCHRFAADTIQRPNIREVLLPIPKAHLEPMSNGH